MTTPVPIPIVLPNTPEYTLLVQYYNENLVSRGMIQWATVTATLHYNAVGSWQVTLPYTDAMWQMMMSGDFVVMFNWRGVFVFGGKCETPAFSNSIPGASGSGSSSSKVGPWITLSGADFLAIIANRICFPDPTKVWAQQLPNSADIVVAPLESAIKWYVNRNIGTHAMTIGGNACPAAIPSRQHPLLDVAPDQGRGPMVSYAVRFGSGVNLNLMDVIRALISQAYPNSAPGQGMGVNVKLNGSRLLFDVYIPQNRTNVSFSEAQGNLTAIDFSLTDPTVTDALVQGATPLMDNTKNPPVALPNPPHNPFFEASAAGTTLWNKIEQYTDETQEDNEPNVKSTAANALVSGGMGPAMTTTVTDTPYTIFGRDYNIGDVVSVEVQPGNSYTDIVTGITLTADPTATPILNMAPVIGNSSNSEATNPNINKQLIARIKTLEKRLSAKGL